MNKKHPNKRVFFHRADLDKMPFLCYTYQLKKFIKTQEKHENRRFYATNMRRHRTGGIDGEDRRLGHGAVSGWLLAERQRRV